MERIVLPSRNPTRRRPSRPLLRRASRQRSANSRRRRMDEQDWYDEDPYLVERPYVIVEKRDSGFGSFIIGLALGAGAALLFAPQTGEETRRGIARRARRAQDFVEDVSGTVADKF